MEFDYKKLGLKCGIEIHQQLEGCKLFCNCPTLLRDDKPDVVVKRKLRAVAGETGEIDVAAAHEMAKELVFNYEAYSDTTCLIELDEEPPGEMNKEALNTTLQAALMLHAKPVDLIQVMRKTVVDGSNTSGFQRTALVAQNGYIETNAGKVKIPTISVEEDAAKIIKRDADSVTYRLDRLGIPLIEIGTDPDITYPQQCREVAEKLGMILRSTGKVKRGLGTIRQDVNVSIKDGSRIEIKGAQDLKMIAKLVENEVQRQVQILKFSDELKQRKIKISNPEAMDVSNKLKNTKCGFVNKAISEGKTAIAFKLEKFNGLLGLETQPGKRIGSELSDFAKVKTGIGGIIHSDEKLEKYKFSEKEIEAIKKKLEVNGNSAFVIIVDKKEKALKAKDAVTERIEQFSKGVPREVRKANQDGTTTFLRPMPGAARMYPETDVMPIRPDVKHIKLPELITEKSERFAKDHGLGKDLANLISKSGKGELFEDFVKRFSKVKPAFIAETILSAPREIKRKYNLDISKITDDVFEKIFDALHNEKIAKDSVMDILIDVAKGAELKLEKFALMSEKELEKVIKKLIAENKDLPIKALIGKAMGMLKGKASGKKIFELLSKLK